MELLAASSSIFWGRKVARTMPHRFVPAFGDAVGEALRKAEV